MLGITNLTTYIIGVIVIILLPGPNSLYVLSVAAQRGVRYGLQGMAGVFVGDSVLMLLAATGAASVLKANPALFAVVKYAGAAYLAWMGLAMLLSSLSHWRQRQQEATEVSAPVQSVANPFRRALVISLMNPKAILFFLSFFVQFVQPDYPLPAVTFLALGVILQCVSMLYLSLVVFTGMRLSQTFRRARKLTALLKGSAAALFFGFGIRLALASIS